MNNPEAPATSSRKNLLVALICTVFIGLSSTLPVHSQDCGFQPCTGVAPAIWPDRSAAMANTIRVLGWNLNPLTDYEFIMIQPDGMTVIAGVARTSEDGDLLLDDGDGVGDPLTYVVGDVLGVYEVRAYVAPWSGNSADTPTASTTFFHNNFGNHF